MQNFITSRTIAMNDRETLYIPNTSCRTEIDMLSEHIFFLYGLQNIEAFLNNFESFYIPLNTNHNIFDSNFIVYKKIVESFVNELVSKSENDLKIELKILYDESTKTYRMLLEVIQFQEYTNKKFGLRK